MVERFSLNLSYRGLPRRASEQAVVYPLSVGEELSKMYAFGRGQRERFRRYEVLRHREHGRSRDEVPNYYACENRILEPSVKSRARKKYHLSAGTNTVKFVYLGASVRVEIVELAAQIRSAPSTERKRLYFRRRKKAVYFRRGSSHYADIRSAYIR